MYNYFTINTTSLRNEKKHLFYSMLIHKVLQK